MLKVALLVSVALAIVGYSYFVARNTGSAASDLTGRPS